MSWTGTADWGQAIYLIPPSFLVDSIEMASQPAVGVIPLGTGNDLARCLRWGGGYEGESIPKLMDKINRSSVVMMDRWSIQVTNHTPPPHPTEVFTFKPKVSLMGGPFSRWPPCN